MSASATTTMVNQKGVVEVRVVEEEVMSASATTTMVNQKGVVEVRVVEEGVMSASATSTMVKQKGVVEVRVVCLLLIYSHLLIYSIPRRISISSTRRSLERPDIRAVCEVTPQYR